MQFQVFDIKDTIVTNPGNKMHLGSCVKRVDFPKYSGFLMDPLFILADYLLIRILFVCLL